MDRRFLFLGLLLVLMLPTFLYQYKRFDNYEVCPYSKRYGHVYPAGTFVLKQKCVNELTRMLGILVRALDQCKIRYFICGGSLLGYMRHNQSMIPFDDDIDLCIFASDKQLRKIEPLLQDLRLQWFLGWWKITSSRISFLDRLSISIDLFQMTTNGDAIVLKNRYARSKWPKTRYPLDLVFPLKQGIFCGVSVSVPQDPLQLLKSEYGEDCMKVGYINNIHSPLPYLALNFSLQPKPSQKITIKV